MTDSSTDRMAREDTLHVGAARPARLFGLPYPLAVFLDLHARWEAALAARGEPFYLALWVFHPRFHRTQLVAALGEGAYEQAFLPAPGAPPRPPALYDAPDYDLGALAWTPGLDTSYVLQSDLDAFPEDARWFERQRHRVADDHVASNGERVYALRAGTVWVGRRRLS